MQVLSKDALIKQQKDEIVRLQQQLSAVCYCPCIRPIAMDVQAHGCFFRFTSNRAHSKSAINIYAA